MTDYQLYMIEHGPIQGCTSLRRGKEKRKKKKIQLQVKFDQKPEQKVQVCQYSYYQAEILVLLILVGSCLFRSLQPRPAFDAHHYATLHSVTSSIHKHQPQSLPKLYTIQNYSYIPLLSIRLMQRDKGTCEIFSTRL